MNLPTHALPRWRLAAWAPLVLAHPGLRQALESQMALHMLVEFPLLLAGGWGLSRRLGARLARIDALDAHGLLGVALASCVSAFWMIPAALDWALLDPVVACAKYATWLGAGMLLARSWERFSDEVAVFFIGNLAWMFATAGLLYRESDSRLCVSYLTEDQAWTGNGLLALALGLGALALRRVLALTSSPAAAVPPRSSSSGSTAGPPPGRP